MSGDGSYAGHDPTAVLLMTAAGAITVLWLVVYAVRGLVRVRTVKTTGDVFKSVAAFGWGGAVGTYTWGLLHLFFLDEANQADACRAVLGTRQVTGYDATFIPLHFGCRTSGGHVVEAVIPAYVNPAVTLLGACAVILTGFVIAKGREERK
ncbi:hypothetical protein ACIHFE_30330 [Streptomyces sp. NPDC052396]|uniref:hypothetical protein n=1 Tax=Streptomyces sp. NPDC052396 TaxID=3365689 RepID=UPI0037D2383C